MTDASYFYGLGRRKSATARVRLSGRSGDMTINNQKMDVYLGNSKYLHNRLLKPFNILELDPDKYLVTVKVKGGGQASQVDAIRLAISKALVGLNEDFRATLKRADLLGRDPREKERKKFGRRSARKKQQYTKR